MNPTDRELLYAERDAEALGEFYIRHVRAMTAEGLHAKSDIAAELAWRDAQIASLHQGREDGRAVADVREMKTSAGSDFYVCVQVGSRYLTPSKYREKWQADFDAAEWNALFTGGERPDVLAFGPPAALEAE